MTALTEVRVVVGTAAVLAVAAVIALAIGTTLRRSAAAVAAVITIGVVLGLLYLFPVIASALNPHWSRHLQQIGPMSAGLYIQATTNLRSLPLTPWQGLGVLALWATGALLAGGLVLRLRDA